MDAKREIDSWDEDDYKLILTEEGDEDFRLICVKPGQPETDVTKDFEAYARRIKSLKEGRL